MKTLFKIFRAIRKVTSGIDLPSLPSIHAAEWVTVVAMFGLAISIAFSLSACTETITEYVYVDVEVEVEVEVERFVYPQYDLFPRVGGIPVTLTWREWNVVYFGRLINTSADTFRNVTNLLTIRDAIEDTVISQTVGYFTRERTAFEYHPEFPYKKELNLAPNVNYYFYTVSDTIRLKTWFVNWFITPLVQDGTAVLGKGIEIEMIQIYPTEMRNAEKENEKEN